MSMIIQKADKPKSCENCNYLDTVYGEAYCQLSERRLPQMLNVKTECANFCRIKELVYCKQCTRYKPLSDGYGECNKQGTNITVKESDFCSFGEKRSCHENNNG